MAHVRKQIRAAVLSSLAGTNFAGSRVFDSRTRPLAKGEGDSIFVYAAGEAVDYGAQGAQQRRTLTIRVDAITKDKDGDAQDALDDASVEIEQKIFADQTFGGLALETALRSCDFVANGQGETPLAIASHAFQITYFTEEGDPETAL